MFTLNRIQFNLTLFLALVTVGTSVATGATKGKVLVVLSSESKITLKDGAEHPTGFFLIELASPVRMLKHAGYEVEYANPKGTKPVVDAVSNTFWFDKDKTIQAPWFKSEEEFNELQAFCINEGVCSADSLEGTITPKTLSAVSDNLNDYAAVFFPGGHAPMEDLLKDPEVKKILQHFHKHNKPTALICHAPIALLAALDDPEQYINALIKDDRNTMALATENWIYKNYKISIFTTREEMTEEPHGADNALGGYVRFYPDEALEKANAYIDRADKWIPKVSIDRELITGQNPFSDKLLGEALVNALNEQSIK